MLFELQSVRRKAGFTQQSASDALGVPLGTYRNWEQLICMPKDKDKLKEMADLFGVPMEALFGYDLVEPGAFSDEVNDPLRETKEYLLKIFDSLSGIGQTFLLEQAEYLAEKYPKNNGLSNSGKEKETA